MIRTKLNDTSIVRKVKPILVVLLFSMLTIRIGFGFILAFSSLGTNSLLYGLVDSLTYLLTAIFIIIASRELESYKIDAFAVVIIVFIKPISVFIAVWQKSRITTMPQFYVTLIISVVLLVVYSQKHSWDKDELLDGARKYSFGMAIGLLLSIALAFLQYILFPSNMVDMTIGFLLFDMVVRIIQQAGYAAVFEEPVFRGFLWGILEKFKMKQSIILVVQMLLFTIAHFYYVIQDKWFAFAIVVPVASLVFGALILKKKSITSSMGAHSVYNAIATNLYCILLIVLRKSA